MGKLKEATERIKEVRQQLQFDFYDGIGNPLEAVKVGRPKVLHYLQGGIEPIDFINSNNINFNLGNAIKYITRCNHKGQKVSDLKKAIDYINFELEKEENE